MRINSISNYYAVPRAINFKGNTDENQGLTPALREIFADSKVPAYKKKILWKLSEIPNFCEASKQTPKKDLIELSERILTSKTNILKMALNGGVKISYVNDKERIVMHDLIPLKHIVDKNKEPLSPFRRSLLDIIKELPILRIERDAQNIYKNFNIYPHNMIVKSNGNCEAIETDDNSSDEAKVTEILLKKLSMGDKLSANDGIIIFDEQIKGIGDNILNFIPVPGNLIEKEIKTPPEKIKTLLKLPSLEDSVSSLSMTPYFYNLIKDTPIENIEKMAIWNKANNNIIARMLNNELNFNIFNISGKDISKYPVIDPKRILLNKALGEYPTNDFMEIMEFTTPVMSVCLLNSIFKKSQPDAEIKAMVFEKGKENFINYIYALQNDGIKSYTIKLSLNNPIAKRFMPILEKAPLLKVGMTFD